MKLNPRRLIVPGLAAAALLASARLAAKREVSPGEERVFRAINGAPRCLHVPVWTVMQSGSLGSVFVISGVLRWRKRPRTASTALLAGTAVWGGVKALKPGVGRGRPGDHLQDISVRGPEQTGLGYPSGHAAVAATLALIATRGHPPAIRTLAIAGAAVTGAARVYVGAHLPLDIAGGIAIGVLAGRAANAATTRTS